MTAVDLLMLATERARPMLASGSTKDRIHRLWSAVKKSRDLAASDVLHEAFMMLAIETNLIDQRGYWTGTDVRDWDRRYGAEDVSHVIRWALVGKNPFEKGPLR